MKLGLVLFNLVFIMLLSCSGDQQTTPDTETSEKDDTAFKITAEIIEKFDYADYALSTDGENAVKEWEKYQELAIQVGYLKKGDLSFFNGDNKLLKKFIETFKIELPDALRTNPIESRVIIVETALLRLNENLTLDNIDKRLKLESVKEVVVAFSNLNFLINKKLIRDKGEKIQSQY